MRRALPLVTLCLLVLFCLAAPGSVGAQTRPAITGIAFFRAYTTQPAKAETFYGPTMGFPEMKGPDGMLIFPVNRSQWVEILTTPPPPKANDRLAAVAFTTRDVAGMQRFLASKGFSPTEPLHDGQFAVTDPEGNLVYFVESPYPTATGSKTLSGIPAQVAASRPLPSATSHRMIHVGFMVTDKAREDAFWQQTLGFRPYWHGWQNDPSTKDDYISLQVPDGTDWLEYMMTPDKAASTLQHTGVMNHFSLGTDKMQTVLAQLQSNKCEGKACTSIQAGRDGKIQLNLYDPDLTRVEYMEFTNAMKPCCSDFTGTMPSEKESQ